MKREVITGVTGAQYDVLPNAEQQATEKVSILDEAAALIYGDREKTYGPPEDNLSAIAQYWSTHLSTRHHAEVKLDAEDVCLMMVLLKAARLAHDTRHRDGMVDACGYFALMERVQK